MATIEQQPVDEVSVPRARVRISGFIITVQAILFLVHWFVYQTWTFFRPDTVSPALLTAVVLLSVSFIAASLLAFRQWNVWVRAFYSAAAVWLGFLNFFFLAAVLSWAVYIPGRLFGLHPSQHGIAAATFGLAVLAGFSGLLHAHWPRVKKVGVALPNLPAPWRGRSAAVVSDAHLGHVNGAAFLRRIVEQINQLRPDIVFLPGDLFDGSHADLDEVLAPLRDLSAPFGAFFVTGNHEEFSDRTKYLRAVERVGIRVLNNEKVNVEGLQIVGVHDAESSHAPLFASVLSSAQIDPSRASILLTHVPRALQIPENAGVSLQLSGHTHGGQIFPFTWFTRRIFGAYTHGLNRFGKLLVYTSYGAGTWGPPMRLGTTPEIVLLEFR